MWQAFQRYKALDRAARNLFWRAVVLFPWISLSLRLRGFKKTRQSLQMKRLSRRALAPEDEHALVRQAYRMVRAAGRYGIVRPTCLVESLALWHLLGELEISTTLRIGVRKLPREFQAHAWVEYAGSALSQSEEHRHYAAFNSELLDASGGPL